MLKQSRPSSRRRKVLYNKLLDIHGPNCYYCEVLFETGIRSRQMTLDHYDPLALGGTSGLSNLVLSCYACNSYKGRTYGDAFKRSRYCRERRNTILGYMEVHQHESILFIQRGNWSCLCGACGTAKDDPKIVQCTLMRYGRFYRPS